VRQVRPGNHHAQHHRPSRRQQQRHRHHHRTVSWLAYLERSYGGGGEAGAAGAAGAAAAEADAAAASPPPSRVLEAPDYSQPLEGFGDVQAPEYAGTVKKRRIPWNRLDAAAAVAMAPISGGEVTDDAAGEESARPLGAADEDEVDGEYVEVAH
jgi:hypothetical protein